MQTVKHDAIDVNTYLETACLVKRVLISDLVDEITWHNGSGNIRVWKHAAILENLTPDMVSTLFMWFSVHASVSQGIGIILPAPNS